MAATRGTITLEAGRLVARKVERHLQMTAAAMGVGVTIQRLPGLFEVGFIVRACGDRTPDYFRAVTKWLDQAGE